MKRVLGMRMNLGEDRQPLRTERIEDLTHASRGHVEEINVRLLRRHDHGRDLRARARMPRPKHKPLLERCSPGAELDDCRLDERRPDGDASHGSAVSHALHTRVRMPPMSYPLA